MEAIQNVSQSQEAGAVNSIALHAAQHCEVSISVGVGQAAVARAGHVVRRVSRSEWEVVSCPVEARYQYPAGQVVLGRAVFWRMNGLAHKLS